MNLRDDRGAAAVELVILAPVILLLLAAMLAGGRLISTKSGLESVAREAARAASQERDSSSAIQRAEWVARSEAATLGMDPEHLSVDQSVGDFRRGEAFSVEVSYPVRLIDLPSFRLIPSSITVSARQVETVERYRSR